MNSFIIAIGTSSISCLRLLAFSQVAALSDDELSAQGFKPDHVLDFKCGLREWHNSTRNSESTTNKKSAFAAAISPPNDLPLETALAKYGLSAYAPVLRFHGITNVASLRYATASDEYFNHKSQAVPDEAKDENQSASSSYLEDVAGMKPLDAWQLQRCAFNEPLLPVNLPGEGGNKVHQSTWPTKEAMVGYVVNLELEACASSLTPFEGYSCASDPECVGTLDQVMAHELDLAAAHNYTIPRQTTRAAAAPTA